MQSIVGCCLLGLLFISLLDYVIWSQSKNAKTPELCELLYSTLPYRSHLMPIILCAWAFSFLGCCNLSHQGNGLLKPSCLFSSKCVLCFLCTDRQSRTTTTKTTLYHLPPYLPPLIPNPSRSVLLGHVVSLYRRACMRLNCFENFKVFIFGSTLLFSFACTGLRALANGSSRCVDGISPSPVARCSAA